MSNSSNNRNTAKTVFYVIGVVAIFLLFVPAWSIGQAFVIRQVWRWYAVAQFGMPDLKLSHCFLGVYMVSLLVSQAIPESAKQKDEHPWAALVGELMAWVLFLGLAWWLR